MRRPAHFCLAVSVIPLVHSPFPPSFVGAASFPPFVASPLQPLQTRRRIVRHTRVGCFVFIRRNISARFRTKRSRLRSPPWYSVNAAARGRRRAFERSSTVDGAASRVLFSLLLEFGPCLSFRAALPAPRTRQARRKRSQLRSTSLATLTASHNFLFPFLVVVVVVVVEKQVENAAGWAPAVRSHDWLRRAAAADVR